MIKWDSIFNIKVSAYRLTTEQDYSVTLLEHKFMEKVTFLNKKSELLHR